MSQIQRDYDQNKQLVIDMLIQNVMQVNKEIPKVVKGNFNEDE